MYDLPRALLSRWSDLWRYPQIAEAVAAEGERVAAANAIRGLARGAAAVLSPEAAVCSLLDRGKFAAASLVLALPAFRKVCDETDAALRDRLEADLRAARGKARDRVRLRCIDIGTRALRIGLESVSPRGLEEAVDLDADRAGEMLDAWEDAVSVAERDRAERLRARVAAIPQATTDVENAWRESISLSLDLHRFELVERLLDDGPDTRGLPDDPATVPRLPRWDTSVPVADALRMLIEPEGAGQRPPDAVGMELLAWLAGFSKPQFVGDAGDVRKFADLLDEFLSPGSSRPRDVREWGTGFATVLFALEDRCIPRLACLDGQGVPLWLPREPYKPLPADLRFESAILTFAINPGPAGTEAVLPFDATMLVRLMESPSVRRLNFLRTLFAQVPPALAIPATFDSSCVKDVGEVEIQQYAATLLDFLSIFPQTPSTLDLVVFLASGRVDVLVALLDSSFQVMDAGAGVLTSDDIYRAWNGPRFRATVGEWLFVPLREDTTARAILACVYAVAGADDELTLDDVVEFLREEWHLSAEDDLNAAVGKLAALGMLKQSPEDGRVRLPRSGVEMLVREHLVNPEEFGKP